MLPKHASVVIAGAGPIGLTIGNFLGLAGIHTLILERNSNLSDCPKAIALDDEALRTCQAMGLLEPILQNMLLDIDAHYISGKRLLVNVAPTTRRYGFPFVSTFHQPTFEATLLAGLERFSCVNVRFHHTVEAFEQTNDGVIVSVLTPEGIIQQVECVYLLGCDGGKSAIRRSLSISMAGVKPRRQRYSFASSAARSGSVQGGSSDFVQKWLVIDSSHDDDHSAVATFFCNPARPAVSVPAPHQGRRWEFMLLPGEQEEGLLDEAKIHALIRQVGGPPHPQIIRKAVYTFHAVLATSFSRGRVFLLGDAAHLMPPFGGQGLNSGLRDAHNLSWKLALVLQGLASTTLLDTYDQERREHVAQMIKLSQFLGSIVMPTSRSVALLRDAILLTLNALPPVREYFTEAHMKPQPRYKQGFLLLRGVGLDPPAQRSGARFNPSAKLTGIMLPQPQVTTSQGGKTLLDEVLGPGFSLLRLHHDPVTAFAPISADIWSRLGVRFVCVQADNVPLRKQEEQLPESEIPVVIQSKEMSDFLLNNQNLFVLARPDRYIFGVFRQEQANAFALAFQKRLGA